MKWVRRGIIVSATVLSLAFAGGNTSVRANRADSGDAAPLAIFSVADRVPVHLVRDRFGLTGLASVPDPFVDVVSLAAVGLGLLGIGRHLSRRQSDRPRRASDLPLATEDTRS